MEITFAHYLGGNATDGYQDNDQLMAQATVDDACLSATIIERQRIVNLLKSGWDSPVGPVGLDTILLNFIVSKGDDLTAEDITLFIEEIITYIKESN